MPGITPIISSLTASRFPAFVFALGFRFTIHDLRFTAFGFRFTIHGFFDSRFTIHGPSDSRFTVFGFRPLKASTIQAHSGLPAFHVTRA